MNEEQGSLDYVDATGENALAEAEARYARLEAEYQGVVKELEEARRSIETVQSDWTWAADLAEIPICLIDRDFRVLRCNQAYRNSAGATNEQIIDRPYFDVFPIAHGPSRICLRAMETGLPGDEEVRIGNLVYRSRVFTVKDTDGAFRFAVHFFVDITSDKRAQDMLVESRELLQIIVENTPIRMFWKDANSRFMGCNALFAKDAGCSVPVELIGLTDADMPWKEQAGAFRADDKLVMDSGIPKLAYEEQQVIGDGRSLWCRVSKVPLRDQEENVIGVLGIYEDITQQKVMEAALKESEDMLRKAQNIAHFGSWKLNLLTSELTLSEETCRIYELEPQSTGYTLYDVLGKIHPDDCEKAVNAHEESKAHLDTFCSEHRLVMCDGRVKYVCMQYKTTFDHKGEPLYSYGTVHDVTESKLAEVELRRSEEKYRVLYEESMDGLFITTPDGRIADMNKMGVQMFGYPSKESMFSLDLATDIWDDASSRQRVLETINERGFAEFEATVKKRNGDRMIVHAAMTAVRGDDGVVASCRGIMRDITEQKQAEQALQESEEKFRSISLSAQDAIIMMDSDGCISFWNPAAEKILGYSAQEVLGLELHSVIVSNRFHDAYRRGSVAFKITGEGPAIGKTLELTAIAKGGREFPVEISLSAVRRGNQWHAIGILRDISQRKEHETKIKELNTLLLAVRRINEHVLIAESEEDLYQFICKTLSNMDPVRAVWICRKMPDYTLLPVAWAGVDEDDLLRTSARWDESALGRGLLGTATRENRAVVIHDARSDAALAPWRDLVYKLDARCGVGIPLVVDGDVIGGLVIYSNQESYFDDEIVRFLTEVAGDATIGVKTMRLDQKLLSTLDSMQKSLHGTVETIASMVEYRDPYTAGHERRVAQLACAIGRELGLPEYQIEGLRVASYIHDLGKISIPAEILSKPSALTHIERQLVMQHAQAGYDILKKMEFPWPVPRTVLQHHERLDGSGYPQGLKGDDIIMEARIVAVADVVEAMSSHRPYRPSLGVPAALSEICRKRDTAFDGRVVDACLALFNERKFRFEE
ncbi:MAG: PAS domain S-box protein [Capsulimonadaceae bacterium]|nr:PAS domain S-box protein [Capsulimonadaceae bacterium]